jgi:putative transposase
VPARTREKRRIGAAAGQTTRLRATRPDELWALDLQADQTADGRSLRLVNVVDEFTREALVMHAARGITADHTVAELERLVARRGRAPAFLRCDNGPEPTSHALRDRCRFSAAETACIEPGAPWQNPFVESFHSRVRDELLNVEEFACLAEARVLIDDWQQDYNQRRPHSSLGMRTPAAFAANWTADTAPA